jgi:hypothetical protein
MRVSTLGQNLDLQMQVLRKAGYKRIFHEKISGASRERPEFQRMLDQLNGDTVIVWKLDRLARSTRDLVAWLYGLKLSPQDAAAANIHPLPICSRERELDARPLTTAREPNDRMSCVCRHFSTKTHQKAVKIGTRCVVKWEKPNSRELPVRF